MSLFAIKVILVLLIWSILFLYVCFYGYFSDLVNASSLDITVQKYNTNLLLTFEAGVKYLIIKNT